MIPPVELMLALYALSIGAVAFLSFFPLHGPREDDKATVMILSLLALTAAGCFRFYLDTGFLHGGLLAGTALNISLLLGTRLDPLRAVVHWADDRREIDKELAVALPSESPNIEVARDRKAWPTLLFFVASAAFLVMLFPDLYFPSL